MGVYFCLECTAQFTNKELRSEMVKKEGIKLFWIQFCPCSNGRVWIYNIQRHSPQKKSMCVKFFICLQGDFSAASLRYSQIEAQSPIARLKFKVVYLNQTEALTWSL